MRGGEEGVPGDGRLEEPESHGLIDYLQVLGMIFEKCLPCRPVSLKPWNDCLPFHSISIVFSKSRGNTLVFSWKDRRQVDVETHVETHKAPKKKIKPHIFKNLRRSAR